VPRPSARHGGTLGCTERERARAGPSDAIKSGVPIVLGTDATVYPHGLNARELAVLVEAGLSPSTATRWPT
jgi:imidazolonepropionase-like amidohydrolase